MSVIDNKTEVDEGLYSRQLYVYGHDAQKRMASTDVLLIGLKGLGIETAKNVILAGVRTVGLLDNEITEINDLGSQFYLSEADVGNVSRAKASLSKLSTLNPYVNVHIVEDELVPSIISKYSVVVLNGATVSEQARVNDLCRQCNVKFIAGDIQGVFLSVFVDDGPHHTVNDPDGNECLRGLISHISNGSPGIVTTSDENRHGLSTGMYVTFEDVEGMTELNTMPRQPIKVISPYSFSICDTSKMPPFTGTRAYFNQVKVPEVQYFLPLSEALIKPEFSNDMMGDVIFNHAFNLGVSAFRVQHGRHPNPTDASEATEVVNLISQELAKIDNTYTLDEDQKTKFWRMARVSKASLSPFAAIGGGVIAQEVLKACSGKFTPIKQFYYFSAYEALTDVTVKSDLIDYSSTNSRYDDYINTFGKDVQTKIAEQTLFLVGAGAIGCEMLKNWALMGVSTSGSGSITVTDMDTIEKSNLNRQFLFRANDVGKLKSKAAAQAAAVMNPSIRIIPQSLKVAADTESTYNDAFWAGLSGVYTALDNVDARLYVDQMCVQHKRSLVDSGTLGTAGNTQVVVPYVTESYGSTRDPPEQGIPICTLKNFPHKIEHTIQWARDVFEGDFKQSAEEVNNYLTNKNYIESLTAQQNTMIPTLKTVQRFLVTDRPKNFNDCIIWARQRFDEEFSHKIQQLLVTFPPDSLTTEGTPFWSGTKRAPTPLEFDVNDDLDVDFVIAAANLHAYNYKLHGHTDREQIKEVLKTYKSVPFVAKKIKVATTDAEAKAMADAAMVDVDINSEAQEIINTLPEPSSMVGFKLDPVEFEKDDDTNFHIAYITACSNLRARNYSIKEESAHMTKFIAGKIIPAIATTTAIVTGLVCIEMYKLVQKKPLEAYRNSFVTLAVNTLAASEPFPPAYTTTKFPNGKEWKWSLWDSMEIDLGHEPTMGELIQYIKDTYQVNVSMLNYGQYILMMDFGMGLKPDVQARMNKPITEAIEEISKTPIPEHLSYLIFEASISDEDDEDLEIPSVRVKFRY